MAMSSDASIDEILQGFDNIYLYIDIYMFTNLKQKFIIAPVRFLCMFTEKNFFA